MERPSFFVTAKRSLLHVVYLLAAFLVFLSPEWAGASEPRRVALVIGNSNYKLGVDLKNPVADAADMQVALQRLGFKLVVGQDLSYAEFDFKLREFREAMRKADVALFFYAGHAVQFKDENYLLPTDITELKSAEDVTSKSIALSRVIEEMGAYAKSSIVLLDACRDSPSFQTPTRGPLLGSQFRVQFGSGLARIQASNASDRFIGFAAAPGTVAQDGRGKNSPFTEALLRHISKPEADIGTIFSLVRGEVIRTTKGRQQPEALNALSAPVVLRSSPVGAGGAFPIPSLPQEESQQWINQDGDLWLTIRDTNDPRLFEDYLQQFPRGRYASLARRKLDQLRAPGRPVGEPDSMPAPGNAAAALRVDTDVVIGVGVARITDELPRAEAVRAATAQARAVAIASKIPLPAGALSLTTVATTRQAAQMLEFMGRGLLYDESITVLPDDANGDVRVEARGRLRKLAQASERRLSAAVEPIAISAGQPLQFKVASRRDSPIGVFAWQADGSVVRLFPEASGKPVVLKAGQTLWFPRAEDQIARISSAPMPGERVNHEALVIVGAGAQTAFEELVPSAAGAGTAAAGIPHGEFLNRLAALPDNDLDVVVLGYEVRR